MSFLLSTVAIASLLLAVLYGGPWIYRCYQVYRWNRQPGKIALTFDDGPDSRTTPELLDLLERLEVPATFYLVGFRALQCPDVIARLKNSPHLLGSHSHNHLHAWKVAPWREFQDAVRGIRTLCGVVGPASPYRPPFGKLTLPTLCWMWLQGREVHWWCFDTQDHADEPTRIDKLAGEIVDSRRPVVLMHCHHAEQERRRFVLNLTEAVVREARHKGLEFVTMDQFATSPR